MGFRFRRSKRIAPGLRLNLSTRGIGLSAGVRGLRVGLGPRGPYVSAGIPGTGLYGYWLLGHRTGRQAPRRTGATHDPASASEPRAPPPICGRPLPAHPAAGWAGLLLPGGLVLLMTALAPLGVLALVTAVGLMAFASRTPAWRAHDEESRAVRLYRQGVARGDRTLLDRALEHAQRCLALTPSAERAHYVAGACLLELDRPEEALAHLERVEGDEVPLLLRRLLAYARPERHREVLEALRRLPPDLQETLPLRNLRAAAHLGLGEPDVALEVLRAGPVRRRIEKDPDLLALHYLLGRCHEALGKKDAARRAYARVVAEAPDFADTQERLEALRKGGTPGHEPGASPGPGGNNPLQGA